MPAVIRETVADYYTGRVREHGPTARGVDWNSTESQELRFEQLLRVVDDRVESLLDFGCGYGALLAALDQRGLAPRYIGFDVSSEMVDTAMAIHGARANCEFTSELTDRTAADVVVASGVFNVKLGIDSESWRRYVFETLDQIDSLSRRAFAFNVLTSYSDADRKRDDLHYADPCELFDHCKRRYSRHVSLLHDYGLYEFTILVRKD